MTDKERLVLIEHLAKIKDDGDSKRVEIDFHEWSWLMQLAEDACDMEELTQKYRKAIEEIDSRGELILKMKKEIENLKKYKKVLMENSVVRSKAIEAYEDAIRDAVSIAEAQGEDFRLEPWCTLRDILEDIKDGKPKNL